MDFNRVSISIDEFKHIIVVNKIKNYQDSIINLRSQQILKLKSIISDQDSIINTKDLIINLERNKHQTIINSRPFYDNFLVGVLFTIGLIITGALIF